MLPVLPPVDVFACPRCGDTLVESPTGGVTCSAGDWSDEARDGVVDFVVGDGSDREREHYDAFYAREGHAQVPGNVADLAYTWIDADAPWEMQRVWARLGDLAGRTVLLLGNGESFRELFLLSKRPAALIFTDLSPVGLRPLGRSDRLREEHACLALAAVDALSLPARDSSIDVVYGYAFVHHLPDLDRFLSEAYRVLKPGGRCVFLDDAYSPLWQRAKLGVLRPLMALSHRRDPRSPEDVVETLEGGFREGEVAERIRAVGGVPYFERVAFTYYLWRRLTVSVFPEVGRVVPGSARLLRAFRRIDEQLMRRPRGRRNMIRLIWGFEKPRASTSAV